MIKLMITRLGEYSFLLIVFMNRADFGTRRSTHDSGRGAALAVRPPRLGSLSHTCLPSRRRAGADEGGGQLVASTLDGERLAEADSKLTLSRRHPPCDNKDSERAVGDAAVQKQQRLREGGRRRSSPKRRRLAADSHARTLPHYSPLTH